MRDSYPPGTRFGAAVAALAALVLLSSCGQRSGPDPLADDQYAIDQLQMRAAWEQTKGVSIVVAVIDTGVDLRHPDLQDNLVAGHDFVDDDRRPNDANGHGTHVAGTVAAVSDNKRGVIGMAPEAKIMPLKVLDAEGYGEPADVADAIRYAVANGADIINLSLGGSSDLLGRLFQRVDPANSAILEAEAAGVLVVAAAGNDATFLTAFNPNAPLLVVNASNELGTSALFSNFGDPRAVSAPGARILSTAPSYRTTIWPEGSEGYEYLDGTSMACPHAAGVAALLATTGASPAQMREAMIATAVNPQQVGFLGAGIIQADAALDSLRR
jgi:subtilisin family serine protease